MSYEVTSEIQNIIDSNVSKSEKIRLIRSADANISEYRISKLLDIIPQFVNNVLKKEAAKVAKNSK
jgi:hypothetical protein